MSNKTFIAGKTRTNRPGWSVTFRHPLRADSRGKPGLKLRKGLGTTDDRIADNLVEELNMLLADQSWWSIDRKNNAEGKFDSRIVKIFYEGIEAGKLDSMKQRQSLIPLPTKDEGYSTIMFTGTTGAGKTTLLRHVIGAHHKKDRFPSTSTSRTTTADVEIITTDPDSTFEAAITFMPEHEVRAHIDECIEDACLAVIQGADDKKVAKSLLLHRENRFRLFYLLGSWSEAEVEEDNFTFDDKLPEEDDIAENELVGSSEAQDNAHILRSYIERIHIISAKIESSMSTEVCNYEDIEEPAERSAWLEGFGDALYEEDDFSQLSLDILEAVDDRFNYIETGEFNRSATGWPVSWVHQDDNRETFIAAIRWFSSNHNQQFGRLLTPLVDGLRVKGPFRPLIDGAGDHKFVLIDGEGIGHTAKSNSSISTRITRRYQDVDMILIVDNAEQPLQNAPLEMLKSIGSSGNSSKLAMAFTHFDLVDGSNFGTFNQKKDHVLGAARDAVSQLKQSLGAAVAVQLEKQIEEGSYYLGGLDREVEKIPGGFQKQILSLLTAMQLSGAPPKPVVIQPIYGSEGLEIALRDAVEGFQQPWKARLGLKYHDGISKEHWTRVKALARRFANAWSNEYDGLRPVADLVARLQENISKWLETPACWTGESTSEVRNAALDPIRKRVYTELHKLAEERIADVHHSDWRGAFDDSGTGSSYRRAENIDQIYRDAAPIMNAGMSEPARIFLKTLHDLVRRAIEESGGKFK
jgi:energy-coupling factor transporter ATP-binding protein EcfA2